MAEKRPFRAHQGSGKHVFVCYAHADAALVYAEIAALHDSGLTIWYDEGIEAGLEWRTEIAQALDQASVVLFYQSETSVRSKHCVREIGYALDHDIAILRVDLDGSRLTPGLELGLRGEQAIEPGAYAENEYLEKLLRALESPVTSTVPTRKKSGEDWPSLPRLTIGALTAVLLVVAGWLFSQSRIGPGSTISEVDTTLVPLTAIAVMPFDDHSPGGGQDWLATSMAEALAESLNRIEGVRIPGIRSAVILKQRNADLDTIREALVVGSVIEGSVQLAGDELLVRASWIRIDDGQVLWQSRFPRKFENVFEIQSDIAVGVAEAIRTELGIKDVPTDLISKLRYQTNDVRAWEGVRRFIQLWRTRPESGTIPKPDWFDEAERHLNRSMDLDPDFAEAHASLAMLHDAWGNPDTAAAAKAQALELDPKNSRAHLVFAADNMIKWDFDTAAGQFERAGENDWHPYHLLLNYTGQTEKAIEVWRRHVDRDPMRAAGFANLGASYLYLPEPDYRSAATHLERAIELGAKGFFTIAYLATAYAHTGREAEALEIMEAAWPEPYREPFRSGGARGGWQEAHRAIIDVAAKNGTACPMRGWIVHASAGLKEPLFLCLEKILEVPSEQWPERYGLFGPHFLLEVDSRFTEYRDDPRFQEMIRRVKERINSAAGSGDPNWGGWLLDNSTVEREL